MERAKPDWPYRTEPDWSAYRTRLGKLLRLADRDSRLSYLAPGISLHYNWHPFLRSDRQKLRLSKYEYTRETVIDPFPIVEDPDTGETSLLMTPPTMPAFKAFLTIRIPLNDLNMRDVRPYGKVIEQAIRRALKNRPSRSEAPEMVHGITRQRRFLLHCRDAEFDRDLERYRLHVQEGLNFRQIALMELAARKGTPISPDEARKRRVRASVRGESTVRMAVARLYEAAHLKKYQARRRRLDAPAAGIKSYWCNDHGTDCPQSCAFMLKWLTRVNATLPTDMTGKMKPDSSVTAAVQREPSIAED
jgi:hypothetical protein